MGRYPRPSVCSCLPFDAYPYLVLFFLCWITFGSYWVFDTPGAIQTQLTSWFGGPAKYTNADNENLYSVYSYPNVILALFGGFIMDRLTGVRVGTMLFSALIVFGQVLFAFGVQWKLYWLCLVGRFVFGLGGESLTVGQNTYAARWFEGDTLAFALGIVVAFSRIGSSVNFAVTPIFAQMGVPFSVWFGTGMCLLSLVACGYVALFDWFGQARIDTKRGYKEGESLEEAPNLLEIRFFPLASWLIFFICLLFYVSVLTFYTVASKILQNTSEHYSPEMASFFIFIPNFVAIFASPLFGKVMDKLGRSLWVLILASAMMILAHIAFLGILEGWFFIHPAIVMTWIGVAYSLAASSIWPLLPFVIPQRMLGTAYGAMTSIQNLGLAVFPQLIGFVQDAPGIFNTKWEYALPIMIFIACAGLSLLLTFVLLIVDARQHRGVLNAPGLVKKQAFKDLNAVPSIETVGETTPLINEPAM